ncbi:MAG: DUF4249 domain-containing protein [Lutimonas sp.]
MNRNLFTVVLLFILGFTSCTDVIEVEVPTAPPRLVIEASIDWRKGTSGNFQRVKLSSSTPFFENLQDSPVTGAQVKITNDTDGTEFQFQDENNGTYFTASFVPVIGQSYTLQVDHEGETYIARETLTPVAEIDSVFQSTDNGFDQNALEVNVLFRDPANVPNFYLAKFLRQGDLLPTLFDIKDEFTDGNQIRIIYERIENEETGEMEFEPGDVVEIDLNGISSPYYDFMRLLIEQSGNSGNLFSTIPAEIKGNCINVTDPDHYPYGYFRLTEVDKRVYTFE